MDAEDQEATDEEIALRGYECSHCQDSHMEYPDCEECESEACSHCQEDV